MKKMKKDIWEKKLRWLQSLKYTQEQILLIKLGMEEGINMRKWEIEEADKGYY